MAQYIAKAALVIAKAENGSDVFIYEGAPVPGNVTEESIERLVREGFLELVPEDVEVPDGDPSDSWTVAQLTAFAGTKGVDLDGASKKADILAKLG